MFDLGQEPQWVVVIDKAHHLAWLQPIERAENGRVAETSGNAARVENVRLGKNRKNVCRISHDCFSSKGGRSRPSLRCNGATGHHGRAQPGQLLPIEPRFGQWKDLALLQGNVTAVSSDEVSDPDVFEQPRFPFGDIGEHGAQMCPRRLQGSMLVKQGHDPFTHR
jgi:hypothetical protein